jgi:hypothetical protein
LPIDKTASEGWCAVLMSRIINHPLVALVCAEHRD